MLSTWCVKLFLCGWRYDHFLSFVTHTKAYDIYFSCFAFCTIPENGTICESLDSTEKPAGDLKIEADGEVYLCRTNGTEPICSVLHHDQCITSGFYPCQYHWISAQSFANDPASFADPSTDAATEEEAPKPTDTPSAACSFFVPLGGSLSCCGFYNERHTRSMLSAYLHIHMGTTLLNL